MYEHVENLWSPLATTDLEDIILFSEPVVSCRFSPLSTLQLLLLYCHVEMDFTPKAKNGEPILNKLWSAFRDSPYQICPSAPEISTDWM